MADESIVVQFAAALEAMRERDMFRQMLAQERAAHDYTLKENQKLTKHIEVLRGMLDEARRALVAGMKVTSEIL